MHWAAETDVLKVFQTVLPTADEHRAPTDTEQQHVVEHLEDLVSRLVNDCGDRESRVCNLPQRMANLL